MLYIVLDKNEFEKINSSNKITKKRELNLFVQKIIDCNNSSNTSEEFYDCINNDSNIILLSMPFIKTILSSFSDENVLQNIALQNLSRYIVSKYANKETDYFLFLENNSEVLNYTKYRNVKIYKPIIKKKKQIKIGSKRRSTKWKS